MVMETPSPQCVGLEFVRQYYTVLNKAPISLHRFYSENSLFLHGGPNTVDDPTIGQKNIQKKILSLNFQDCHAKIRKVDAHETLGNGVLIQVIGELSNNGMPMRCFMQTFVLAPQSAKKYYVHNDIFRYQDEVFSDEDVADDVTSDPEEEFEACSPEERNNYSSSTSSTSITTVNGTTATTNHNALHPRELENATSPITPAVQPPTHVQTEPPQITAAPTSAPPQVISSAPLTQTSVSLSTSSSATTVTSVNSNSNSMAVDSARSPSPPVPEVDGWSAPSATDEWSDALEEPVSTTSSKPSKPLPTANQTSPSSNTSEPRHSDRSSSAALSTQQTQNASSNEPKTYANLFKSSSFSHHSPIQHPPPVVQNEPTAPISTPPITHSTYLPQPPKNDYSASRSSAPVSSTSPNAFQTQGPGNMNRPIRNFYDDDKRRPAAPDSQQVFVGNLPHSIGEDQLRSEFMQYGKIVEVRINTGKGKTGAKGPGHQVPNFGFIVFDEEEAVYRCLNARPIYLNGENRINVEEKKPRSRVESSGGGMGRPSTGPRGGGNMGSGGMRGPNMMTGGGRGGGRGGSYNRSDSRGGTSRGGGFMPQRR